MSSATETRGTTYFTEAAGRNGKLRCHVVCCRLPADERAQFSLLLRNESTLPAQASAFFPEALDARSSTLMQTSIAPSSTFTTTIALDFGPAGGLPEIHIALGNGEVHLLSAICDRMNELTAGAATPAIVAKAIVAPVAAPVATAAAAPVETFRARRSLPPRVVVVPIILSVATLVALVGGLAARPRIAALDVPAHVGTPADVPVAYRTLGLGAADYTVLRPDGAAVAAGSLSAGAGTFVVQLPPAALEQTYRIRLHLAGLLGSATADASVDVAGAPAPPPAHVVAVRRARGAGADLKPLIRSLAVDRATLAGGETLNVSYAVRAQNGTLELVDPTTQIAYDKLPLEPSGHAAFVAPRMDTPRYLSVVITAEQNNASTQSRIGVMVTPRAQPTSPPSDDAAPPPSVVEAAAPRVDISAPTTVRAGQPLHVRVRGAAAGMQLVLLDSTGHELARRDVAAGDDQADFTAPVTGAPTRLIIEVASPSGDSNEAIVRTINVTP